MEDLEQKLRRLKKKREALVEKRAKCTAQYKQAVSRLKELEATAQEEFGCSLKELEGLRQSKQEELEEKLEAFESQLEQAEALFNQYEDI